MLNDCKHEWYPVQGAPYREACSKCGDYPETVELTDDEVDHLLATTPEATRASVERIKRLFEAKLAARDAEKLKQAILEDTFLEDYIAGLSWGESGAIHEHVITHLRAFYDAVKDRDQQAYEWGYADGQRVAEQTT